MRLRLVFLSERQSSPARPMTGPAVALQGQSNPHRREKSHPRVTCGQATQLMMRKKPTGRRPAHDHVALNTALAWRRKVRARSEKLTQSTAGIAGLPGDRGSED